MRPLPRKIKINGFTYTQALRNGRSAIYEQEVTPDIVYYEVFHIQIKPEKELFGKAIPEREVYPRNEDFGCSAWIYHTLELAVRKILELNHIELPKKRMIHPFHINHLKVLPS